MRFSPALFSILFSLTLNASAQAQSPDGAALFRNNCATCHDGAQGSRAPSPAALKQATPQSVLNALLGSMRVPGSKLSGAGRRAVAEYITGKTLGGDPLGASTDRCESNPAFTAPASAPSWNGWSPDAGNSRFQPAKAAGLTAEQIPHLVLKWSFGFPDATQAWAPATVAGGRVFIGSHNGTVYSLNAKTGCIYWTFSAEGGVRTAPIVGPAAAGRYAVYFGDTSANEYALDAANGKKLWIRKVDDHPLARITGSPAFHNGRLYVPMASYEESQGASPDYECCSFRGSITALDAKNGDMEWKTYVIPDLPRRRGVSSTGRILWGPAGAAIWSAPTVDAKRGLIYAATGNTYSGEDQPNSEAVVAFDIKTGKIVWSVQGNENDVYISGCRPGAKNPNCPDKNGPDFDFGTSPVLAGNVILIGSKSGYGFAMDADNKGKILWRYKVGDGGPLGGIEWGIAVEGDTVYFPLSDITRPNPGGLYAVNIKTGEKVWVARPVKSAQSAAITVIPGAIFSGANDGILRAFSSKDGSVIWQYDTNKEFKTLNGVPGKGASMIGPGPTVAGGMLYVNSGYGAFGGRPGNVLLAFGPE
ncbi:MAG TPA: PQQ-binding-like beta-propeller repeat protein [Bryobacteraceae bacterium]|jgi:polyvinyl alcohol dehydrogenase (cytochrome)|nr:PQQ-binding-like beta-propeller repeat protein [Bryobacteraceae bacterium]